MPILLRCLLILLLSFGSSVSLAQASDPSPPASTPAATPAPSLEQLTEQLDTVRAELKSKDDNPPLADLRATALAVQDQARQLAASLAPQMAALQAQLTVLGPAPASGAPPEASEVAAQRRQLDRAQANLDAQIKQAQLLSQNALQLAAQISGMRNDQFQAKLASRTATPFSRAFWIDPARTLPGEIQRL
jgi:small-conductance mechanosensitive channel